MLWKIRASSNAVSSSTLPVGSSAIKSSGRPTMARAIATSCRSLRDNVEHRRIDPLFEPQPSQQFGNVPCDFALRRSGDAQWQGDIVGDAPILDDPGVLKHDTDTAPQCRPRRPIEPARIAAEQHQPAAARALGERYDPQQSCFAGVSGACQHTEPARIQRQRYVGKDRRTGAIPLSDVLEPHHRGLGRGRCRLHPKRCPVPPIRSVALRLWRSQKFSTQGRSSISQAQALRCWR